MIPYLHVNPLKVGPLPLQPFGMLVALGVLIGVSLAVRRARRLGLDVAQLQGMLTWILVPGFIGGHVFDALLYHPREVLERPWMLLALWDGLSSFGGFTGAVIGLAVWKYYDARPWRRVGRLLELPRLRRRERPRRVLPFADVVLAVFPVAWIFGRAGCAVVHDHPGARAPHDSPLAVAYGPGPIDDFGWFELRHGTTPRYDLGLLEMLLTILLAAAFALTWRRGGASGWYAVAACVLYAPMRFALDFLRVSAAEGGDLRYAGLTPAQWACLALFLFGVALGFRVHQGCTGRPGPRSVTA